MRVLLESVEAFRRFVPVLGPEVGGAPACKYSRPYARQLAQHNPLGASPHLSQWARNRAGGAGVTASGLLRTARRLRGLAPGCGSHLFIRSTLPSRSVQTWKNRIRVATPLRPPLPDSRTAATTVSPASMTSSVSTLNVSHILMDCTDEAHEALVAAIDVWVENVLRKIDDDLGIEKLRRLHEIPLRPRSGCSDCTTSTFSCDIAPPRVSPAGCTPAAHGLVQSVPCAWKPAGGVVGRLQGRAPLIRGDLAGCPGVVALSETDRAARRVLGRVAGRRSQRPYGPRSHQCSPPRSAPGESFKFHPEIDPGPPVVLNQMTSALVWKQCASRARAEAGDRQQRRRVELAGCEHDPGCSKTAGRVPRRRCRVSAPVNVPSSTSTPRKL